MEVSGIIGELSLVEVVIFGFIAGNIVLFASVLVQQGAIRRKSADK